MVLVKSLAPLVEGVFGFALHLARLLVQRTEGEFLGNRATLARMVCLVTFCCFSFSW